MNPFRWALAALAGAVAIVVVAVGIRGASPDETSPLSGQAPGTRLLIDPSQRDPAPEFAGVDAWLNSRPLTLAGLRGRVVLIDFWTFSCVNCVRTIPHLQTLYARDHGRGLEIVGVHSPEFDFEKDLGNVTAATRQLGVGWPVAVDSELSTWNAWSNQYWPAEYLVDQQGKVAYVHVGEGDYEQTDAAVDTLLGAPAAGSSAGDGVPAPAPGPGISPELYAGSERGSLAGGAAYGPPGTPVAYADSGPPATPDAIQVTGSWADHGQWLEATSPGHVRVRFHASDVYVVAGAASGPLAFTLRLDGAAVPAARAGPALAGSVATVSGQGLLHLLSGVPAGTHLLDLAVPAGFRLYTFTFG